MAQLYYQPTYDKSTGKISYESGTQQSVGGTTPTSVLPKPTTATTSSPLAIDDRTKAQKLATEQPVTSQLPTLYNIGGVNVTGQTSASTQQDMANYMPATMFPNGGGAPPTYSVDPNHPTTVNTATGGTFVLPPAPTSQPVSQPTSALPSPPVSTTPQTLSPPPVSLPGTQLSDTLPNAPIVTDGGTMGAAGQVPGAQVTPFGPGDDLRFSSILPTATDRLGLANQYFDQYQESTNPAYEQALREATQRAAANGILGSGMLTNTYGDVATQRANALDLARRGFLTDALNGSIQDAINNRNELRTERGYQTDQANTALAQQIQQLLLESQLGNTSFNQQLDLAQLLGNLGYAGNPDQALLGASDQQQQSAQDTYALIQQLLSQIAQRGG